MHNSGAEGTHGTKQRRYWKLCLPMGTLAANGRNEDFGTSPFFGQLFRQACLPVYVKMGAPGIKNNRSHPLFCRGRHVADLVDRDSVRSAAALPSVDNFSSYPHMATFGSSILCVAGRHRHDD